MEAARRAAGEGARAAAGPVSNEELEACLVAVLCAHAALEGTMNEVGDVTDAAWWATQERRRPFEGKWAALVAKRSKAAAPSKGDPAWDAVCRLTWDRNQVAHFRGLRQADRTFQTSGPPVEGRGGISPIRAYFDAAKAHAAVADAEEAIKALG